MIMDSLRSHMVTMTEIADIRGHRIPIRWYPAKPGAKAFPGFHAFIHPVWEEPKTLPPTGPGVEGPDWEARPKAYPQGPGDHYEGPLAWFQKGIPHVLLETTDFVPAAITCGKPSRTATGGALAGGEATLLAGAARQASGGSLASGTVHVLSPYVKRGAGGALADGTARIVATVVRQGGGGALADGTARVAGQYVRTGSGGALAGGETEGLPALARYGVGGALAGGTCTTGFGVVVPCCPEPIPLTLYARITTEEPGACLDGAIVTLTHGDPVYAWTGTAPVCGGTVCVVLGCLLGPSWAAAVTESEPSWGETWDLDTDCGPPLNLAAPAMRLPIGNGLYSGYFRLEIGETRPPWDSPFVAWMRAGEDLPRHGQQITDIRVMKWGGE